jgi:hypothetical protein
VPAAGATIQLAYRVALLLTDRDELVIVVQAVTNHMMIRCDLLKNGLGMGAVPQYNN